MHDRGTHPLSDDEALRAIVEGVEAEIGDRFFGSLVEHLAAALGVRYAFVSSLSDDRTTFRTLALWGPNGLAPNREFAVAGSPCAAVLGGETSHHPAHLRELFPADAALVELGCESYCGVPIVTAAGAVVGHLAIMHDQPMHDPRGVAVMRIFAARARAEIDRLRAEAALRAGERRLASVLDTAMDAIICVDDRGRIELFNSAAERVFGCVAAAAIGTQLARFLGDGFRDALERSLAALREGAPVHPYLGAPAGLAARRVDGTEFAVEATLSRADVGGRDLFTLILRDVEERRRAEEELRQLNQQNAYLQEEIRAVHNVDELVGASRRLREVLEQVERVAATDSSVLILGETGTGKEVFARAIHARSRRSNRPLIKVNCAALPEGLIESELFGHERGAFTGATEKRIGRFELANGGSIFLDEIGDMPLDVQAKLLRVLQERQFERVGGSRTLTVDVRVIAATNRHLEQLVERGAFRQDLYYRLNVFPIALPPLRDRREDIPLLVHYFVGRYAHKVGRKITHVGQESMRRLLLYGWPGNVRELENVVERAVILSRGTELNVTAELLPTMPMAASSPPPPPAAAAAPAASLAALEREHIAEVLRRTRWRIEGPNGAARLLDVNPSTLRSRIKKLGIRRSDDPR